VIYWDFIKRTRDNKTFFIQSNHSWVNRSPEPRKDESGVFERYQCSSCKITGKCYVNVYPDRIQIDEKHEEAFVKGCTTPKLVRTK